MWQDWTNAFIGLWLTFSPWLLLSYSNATRGMIANCVISGLLITGFAVWAALSRGGKWQEWAVISLCLWLFISWRIPFNAPGTPQESIPRTSWDNMIVGLAVGTFALWSLVRRGKDSRKVTPTRRP